MTGTHWLVAPVAIIACWLGLTPAALAQEPAKACSLGFVTRLPLNEVAGLFTTTVSINDHPIVMMIDTGAAHSAVSGDLAAQLRLPEDHNTKIIVNGVVGEMKAAHPVIAHSFRAGAGHLVDYELAVAKFAGGGGISDPSLPQGLLGADLLSYYELEFDFPNRNLTLYTPNNCRGNFVPWTGPFEAIAARRQLGDRLFIPVRINNQTINAMIDTGANRTAIGIDTAHDIGVGDEALRWDRSGNTLGVPGIPVRSHEHYFDSFTIGETSFRRASLLVQEDNFGVVQMLLGTDFYRGSKLWLSFQSEQVFLQRNVAGQRSPSP